MTFKMEAVVPAFDLARATERIIGCIQGRQPGPTLVFFGGIHGNEPAGVEALDLVFQKLGDHQLDVRGSIYGIRGNLNALKQGKRFLDEDLNRIWHNRHLEELEAKATSEQDAEETEMAALHQLLREIIATHGEPLYFIDLHTTSSKTLPFITINDALINRKFARCFPVPIILGIEEYLDGPLLSFLNEAGYVAIGFESGQHAEKDAVQNAASFIWLALLFSGALKPEQLPESSSHLQRLASAAGGNRSFYEITYRHIIAAEDHFEMLPGFRSFGRVSGGTALAIHNGAPVIAERTNILFMPLYQDQGEDGYFLIRRIPGWILELSALLRKSKLDAILPLLPGVKRKPDNAAKLIVNLSLARFFSRRFFHLVGYRHKQIDKNHVVFTNRELMARTHSYKSTPWYHGALRCFKNA